MNNLFEKAPEIIREAAQSALGILALVVLLISILALAFFSSASEGVRVAIFVLIFLGAGLFVVSVLRLAAQDQSRAVETAQSPAALPTQPEAVDQVAALCYHPKGDSIELLLVKTGGGRWTFPKGNLVSQEQPWRIAERKAFEEAGVLGEVRQEPLATYLHLKRARGELRVAAYPLLVKTVQTPQEKDRQPRWFSPQEAESALADKRPFKYADELRRLARLAAEELSPPPQA
ncbi:MAG: NUDIX domain-containing protein [Anaerolineales bacterium]